MNFFVFLLFVNWIVLTTDNAMYTFFRNFVVNMGVIVFMVAMATVGYGGVLSMMVVVGAQIAALQIIIMRRFTQPIAGVVGFDWQLGFHGQRRVA